MKYQVIWQRIAEEEHASIWLHASDRNAVAAAANWFDSTLSRMPLMLGESRESPAHRIAYRAPIDIEFEVVEDDKRVIVQGVFGLR